jgi:hypothetical protein
MFRWLLAFVAALLTPWIGPHMDRYVPIGWVLIQAGSEKPDAGFWILAGAFLLIAYAAWLLLFSAFAWVLRACTKRWNSSR